MPPTEGNGDAGGDPPPDAGTEPGGSVIPPATLPLTVTQLQARFKLGGSRDQCAISGIIPNLSAQFTPTGQTMILNVGGAVLNVTLDSRGRGRTSSGSVILKFKARARAPFAGGDVPFTAVMKGAWAQTWLDQSAIMDADAQSQPVEWDVSLHFNGNTYSATIGAFNTSRQGKGGIVKK